MPLLDRKTVAVIRTLFLFALLGFFLYAARQTLLLLVFAIFFAYLIEPIVGRLERWPMISRGSRGVAIAEVYFVLCLLFVGMMVWVWPTVNAEGQALLNAAPALSEQTSWSKFIRQVSSTRGWSYHTQLQLEHLVYEHRAGILSFIQQAAGRLEEVLTNILWLILVPILAIFLLKNGRQIVDAGVRTLRISPPSRIFLKAALNDMNDMAANYVRAQLVLAGLSLTAYTIVLVVSGMEYGLILGLIAGALEFVPLVGPAVGAVLIVGTAFLTGYKYVWLLVLFLGVWRLVQDYVTSPRLMHHSVRLHPFAVIVSVLAGAEIGGIVGVFLSIPIAATLEITWRRWRISSQAASLATEPVCVDEEQPA